MDKYTEAIEFIESETMRTHLKEVYKRGEMAFSDKELCSIVWNSKEPLDAKQAYLLSLNDEAVAMELIKRIEAVKTYLREIHENEVFVIIINDNFCAVYDDYQTVRENIMDLVEDCADMEEIYIEFYDKRNSGFRGRLQINNKAELISFDIDREVVKAEKLWENVEADEVINMFIEVPHPFMVEDTVTVTNSLDEYVVVGIDMLNSFGDDRHFYDIGIDVIKKYDDDEDDYSDLAEFDSELALSEDVVRLPLFSVEFTY